MSFFGERRYRIRFPPPDPGRPPPLPIPDPGESWSIGPIYTFSKMGDSVHLFGHADKLPTSNRAGAYLINIKQDGSSAWLDQDLLRLPSYEGPSYFATSNPGDPNVGRILCLCGADPKGDNDSPFTFRNIFGTEFLIDGTKNAISPFKLDKLLDSTTPFNDNSAIGVPPNIFILGEHGGDSCLWIPSGADTLSSVVFSDFDVPSNYPSHYKYRSNRPINLAVDSDGFLWLAVECFASNQSIYIAIVKLDSSGRQLFDPVLIGEPGASFSVRSISCGKDGFLYALSHIAKPVSNDYYSQIYKISSLGDIVTERWPKRLHTTPKQGIFRPSDISTDDGNVYVVGTGRDNIPIVARFSYAGAGSHLHTLTYHKPGENWFRAYIIADNEYFYLASYVIEKLADEPNPHSIVVKKYDQYGEPA